MKQFALFLLASFFASIAIVQTHVSSDLATAIIDEYHRINLHGTMHPLARPEFDQGAVADDFPAHRKNPIQG
jgi:hypothetical protein